MGPSPPPVAALSCENLGRIHFCSLDLRMAKCFPPSFGFDEKSQLLRWKLYSSLAGRYPKKESPQHQFRL